MLGESVMNEWVVTEWVLRVEWILVEEVFGE